MNFEEKKNERTNVPRKKNCWFTENIPFRPWQNFAPPFVRELRKTPA